MPDFLNSRKGERMEEGEKREEEEEKEEEKMDDEVETGEFTITFTPVTKHNKFKNKLYIFFPLSKLKNTTRTDI